MNQDTANKYGATYTPPSTDQNTTGGSWASQMAEKYGATATEAAKPSINDTAALLGATTAVHQNLLQRAGSAVAGGISALGEAGTNFGVGVAKSAIDTAKGIGDIFGLKPTGFGQQLLQSSQTTSQGTMGKAAGEFVGNTAQFLAPGGAEEAAFAKSLPLIERVRGAMGLTGKAGEFLSKGAQIATRAGITGASTAGVTALQTGGDTNAIANNAVLGAVGGGLAQSISTFGKGLATALAKSDFRLSPAAEAKAAQKAESAAQFMTDNKILGSNATKFSKLEKINGDMENAIQSSLPSNVGVPKQQVIDNINSNVESLKSADPAEYNKAKRQAAEAIDLINSQKEISPGQIDAKLTLDSKRSYGSLAFKNSKAVVKDPNVSSEGAYAVEKGFQDALSNTLESNNIPINVPSNLQGMFGGKTQVTLPEFNKVYSNAISARDFSRLAQYKSDSGLFGRLFGLWVGKSIGHSIAPGIGPEIIGAASGELASAHLPGVVRNVAERTALSSPQTTIKGTKTILGATRADQSASSPMQPMQ